MIVAMLSEFPEPQEGEDTCVLSLTEGKNGTFRIRAFVLNNQRNIGRWVSDCALTASESALLWVTRFNWQIQQQEGSLDINQVLEVVERMQPMDPVDPVTGGFIHPQDLLALIALNLPPKDPTSPETGASLQLGRVAPPGGVRGPAPGPQRALTGPVAPVPIQGQRPEAVRRAAPRVDERRQRRVALGSQERESALFFKELVTSMRGGAQIGDVRTAVLEFFDGQPNPSALNPSASQLPVAPELDDDDDEAIPPPVAELAGQLLRANAGMDEEAALDQAFSIYEAQQPVGLRSGDSPLPALPAGLRALRADEPVPGHIAPEARGEIQSFGAEDPSLRGKMERTWAKAGSLRRHADSVSPLPPGLRPALAGAPRQGPVARPVAVQPRPVHPMDASLGSAALSQAAPRQPRPVPVGGAPGNGAGPALSQTDADAIAQEQIDRAQRAATERATRSAAHRDAVRAEHEAELAQAGEGTIVIGTAAPRPVGAPEAGA